MDIYLNVEICKENGGIHDPVRHLRRPEPTCGSTAAGCPSAAQSELVEPAFEGWAGSQ